MAKPKKSEQAKLQEQIDKTAKLFDVAQPGKTAAPATSRPVIVGHGSGLTHDPMMAKASDEKPVKKKEINPIKVAEATPKREAVVQPPQPIEEDAVPVVTPEEQPAAAETQSSVKESQGTPVVDDLMNEVTAKQADKKQKQDLADKTVEVERLIEAKTYFVPIGQSSLQRSHYRIIIYLLLIIILLAVGLNFAIDAEAIDIGMNALTDIL